MAYSNRPGVHCVRGRGGAAPDHESGPDTPTLPPATTVGNPTVHTHSGCSACNH